MTTMPAATRTQVRVRVLLDNVFELFAATLAMVASVTYFLTPVNLVASTVGHAAFPDVLWNIMYGVGALAVFLGLVLLYPRLELAGLSLFAASVTIQALAIAEVRGWPGVGGVCLYVSFAGASIVRGTRIYVAARKQTNGHATLLRERQSRQGW